jgi:GxxExxY protein
MNSPNPIETNHSRVCDGQEMSGVGSKLTIEELSAIVVDAAFHLHRDLGPGLLESVYEAVLTKVLRDQGLSVARQVTVPISFAGMTIDEGFRSDLVVENRLVIELKSVEAMAPVHRKQLLTYLRLMHLPLGLLINFGANTFKDGVTRIINGYHPLGPSRLRVNQRSS